MRSLLLLFFFLSSPIFAGEIKLPVVSDSPATRASRQINEPSNGFAATLPEQWARRSDLKLPGISLIAQTTAKDRVGNCNVRSVYAQRLQGLSNAQYLQRAFPADDPSELLTSYRASGINPKILRSGRVAISGTHGMFVEFDFAQGATMLRTFNLQFTGNGFLYTLGCTDIPHKYAASLPEFGLFVSSFRSIGRSNK